MDVVTPDQHHFGRIFCSQAGTSLWVFRRSQQFAGVALRAVPASAIPNENIVVKEGRTIFLGDPLLVTAQTGGRV